MLMIRDVPFAFCFALNQLPLLLKIYRQTEIVFHITEHNP